ncbi:MAG TPA: fibronectin type III domain-containing protein [Acidimicrobiales bacterium]|nr:fibronectin type III domain-containing protein [Acidimicrobiales bacterium]
MGVAIAALAGVTGLASVAGTASAGAAPAVHATSGAVLLVGSYNGIPGQYATIQDAVNAAVPGDWILVGPGDYHESPSSEIGVWVWSNDIHIRGMNRNTVIVDGTKAGAPQPCDSAPQWQNLGPASSQIGSPTFVPWRTRAATSPAGRNGIYDSKYNGVTVENLTVCNFVAGSGPETGNQVWFDGGHFDRPVIDQLLGQFGASYITTYNTYTGSQAPTYGFFVSNSVGPGTLDHDYASGFNDAGFYVGGCPNCGVTLDQDTSTGNVLGYSGTNSGGNLVIERSIWDFNKSGIAPNSENNDDGIPPQSGECASHATGPLGNGICMLVQKNMVYGNNNPNVPGGEDTGTASEVGTGILLGGSQNVATLYNTVEQNGSWGIMSTDYPNIENPPAPSACQGGIIPFKGQNNICYFPSYGNEIAYNGLTDNGFFGNPTNGDLAEGTLPHTPGNCWIDNAEPKSQVLTSDPAGLDATQKTCFAKTTGDIDGELGVEEACNFQLLGTCAGVKNETGIVNYIKLLVNQLGYSIAPLSGPGIDTLPANYPLIKTQRAYPPGPQQTMPNPCAGVPVNAWCPAVVGSAPTAPQVTSTSSSGGIALVDWSASTTSSGTVKSYTLSAWPGDLSETVAPIAGNVQYARMTGFQDGQPYWFTVTANGSNGTQTTSGPSSYVVINDGQAFATTSGAVYGTNSFVGTGLVHPTAAVIGVAASMGRGALLASGDGNVYATGDGALHGSMYGHPLSAPIVGIEATPDGNGYWLVGKDGGVFTFGDAHYYGSLGNLRLSKPIVGMAVTPDGKGYWLVGGDGGVFTFGDARYHGSAAPLGIPSPAIGISPSPDGNGYWIATAAGGIYSFGLAPFYGSAGNVHLASPVVGIATSPDGLGYWLVTATGSLYSFGTAARVGGGVVPNPDHLRFAGIGEPPAGFVP